MLLWSGLLHLPRTLGLVTYSMGLLKATAPVLVLQTVEPLILTVQPGQRTPRLGICGHKGGATVAGGNELSTQMTPTQQEAEERGHHCCEEHGPRTLRATPEGPLQK